MISAIVLALGLVSRVPARDDPVKKKQGPITSKFEILPTNHMMMTVKINGKGPFQLIFDVGSPLTLLGNKAAEEGGVVKADAPKSLLFNMRGEAEIESLELGDGLKAEKLPVIVMDHPFLNVMSKMLDRRVDGLIGFTFFARYKTTIDYQARKVTFEPVDYKVADLARVAQSIPARRRGEEANRVVVGPLGSVIRQARRGFPARHADSRGFFRLGRRSRRFQNGRHPRDHRRPLDRLARRRSLRRLVPCSRNRSPRRRPPRRQASRATVTPREGL